MKSRQPGRRLSLSILVPTILLGVVLIHRPGVCQTVPFVKQWNPTSDTLALRTVALGETPVGFATEAAELDRVLDEAGVARDPKGTPLTMEVAPVAMPDLESRYADRIRSQAYRIELTPKGVVLQAAAPEGLYYAIQTLGQILAGGTDVATGEIVDWPDLPIRMIMIDAARQNENFDYYRRVVDFCARWKINAILCHLTDDETSCLFQPDYPELMHPRAWRAEDIRALVDYARLRHIELYPEVESLGHSRMFLRRPDYRDILHQTRVNRPNTWMGTNVPGFTNVLCPASDKTYEYLDKLFATTTAFSTDVLHIGCDEVDITDCERCEKKFPGVSKTEWFRSHLLKCREIARRHGKKMALWGDMLLKDPAILDGFPTEDVVVYDWHYLPELDPATPKFFTDRRFEVIASPALVCAPHMIYPDAHNYTNIRNFATIAREQDLLGLNTTIWIPQRYMSDVLWPGIAFAAAHSWGGSRLHDNPDAPLALFFRDYLGSREGAAFQAAWTTLANITWHRVEFLTSCWRDEKGLADARTLLATRGDEARAARETLRDVLHELARLDQTVTRHRDDWMTMRRSAAILDYTFEHLFAATDARADAAWNRDLFLHLDRVCLDAIDWIEEDWNRNRYADDPNKDGRFQPNQHLLHVFNQMHTYHESILATSQGGATQMKTLEYAGWKNCVQLSNGEVELVVTTDVGPRVIRLGFKGGQNLFKEFAGQIGKTGGEEWRIYGGHRFWHAPEASPRSYSPDNAPINYRWDEKTLTLLQPIEKSTGMQKKISITLDPNRPHARVVHRLVNWNLWDVEVAPWALSVLAPGGRAIFPQEEYRPHPDYLLPARPLVLWHYTNMQDPRWIWGTKYIQLRQDPSAKTKQKVGLLNQKGWAAYALNGDVFLKRYGCDLSATYPDMGCNTETYTDANMLELETLGPLTKIPANGGAVEHVEDWFLYKAAPGETDDALDACFGELLEKAWVE